MFVGLGPLLGVGASGRRGRFGPAIALWITVALTVACSAAAVAQRPTTLVELLRDATSFRVRARAALALADSGDERAISALETALQDRHAAVRGAAAVALARVGSRRSVSALRAASSDPSPQVAARAKDALRSIAAREVISRAAPQPVRAAAVRRRPPLHRIRHAVVLGEMRNRSGLSGSDITVLLAQRIGYELRKLDDVAVFSLAEMNDAMARELERRKVPTFRIDGNLSHVAATVHHGDHQIRCEVQLLLMDEPERTLRGMWKGAATTTEQPRGLREEQLPRLARKTLERAVRSATADAARAIAAAAQRRDQGVTDIRAEASAEPPRRRKK